MDFISLIANTGVQFVDLEIKLNADSYKNLRFNYYEGLDTSSLKWWFEELIEIKDLGSFIRKSDLIDLAISIDKVNKTETILKINDSGKKLFAEGEERTYVVKNVEKTLLKFQKKWLPLPYFRNNQINDNLFGPTDWVRIWFEIQNDHTLKACLAIDTTIGPETDQNSSPILNSNPNENNYTLCTNEDSILSFLSEYTGCGWVENWLLDLFELDPNDSQTKHMAMFIHLLRVLNTSQSLPRIQLLSDKSEIIDLDLSIDVGNSRTCAILFETPNDGEVKFNKVKKLSLRNLTHPTKCISEPFSTRIVFRDETFGMKDSFFPKQQKFNWPSPVRLGFESEELINSFQVKRNVQYENRSFCSSPKRYLWDTSMAKQPWNFHDDMADIPKKVYKRGVSEQLKSDGSICKDGAWGATPLYSRRTLMTFLFLELFSQAIAQFNSFEFRSSHGKPNSRRRLRHVIITCPTAMIKEEQIALRQAAVDAAAILKEFPSKVNSESALISPAISDSFLIIPQVSDVRRNLDDLDNKKDWMYDEATCGQLVFLYGLIQHKFDGNSQDLFNLFGHKDAKGDNVLTIGSLDIGGGTSDLMICEYGLNYNNSTELLPNPLYYESFHLAGDDLIKNVIQSIIIEGKETCAEDIGCVGVIENHGLKIIGTAIYSKINGFFGQDAAAMSNLAKMMRVNFLNQIGIPLAQAFLDCANEKETRHIDFDMLFEDKQRPGKDLLDYFSNHFGFRFEDLTWNLNPERVNRIVRSTFSKLILQVSKLMHKYKCDYVVISGRPSSFKEVEQLFLEIHPVQPNRFVNLNNYWIGKWFPFANNEGYVDDPKTIVATGALIGFMATKFFRLKKFKINPAKLIHNLYSTANYIGPIRDNVITKPYLTPKLDSMKFQVFGIPHLIGIKNINSHNYPARNMLQLEYNERYISSVIRMNTKTNYQDAINGYNAKLPYEITISREFQVDKEKVILEDVVSRDGESESTSLFILKPITLPDENGHWFDTGDFSLSIKARN